MHTNVLSYEKAFKRFTLGILYIVIASYIVGGIMYPLPTPINYFFLIGGILNVVPILVAYVVPVVYLKKIIKIYCIIIIIPIYIITVVCLLKGVVTPLFWFMALPVYIYASFFGSKKNIKWLIAYVCLVLSSVALTFILQYVIYDNKLIVYYSLSLYQSLLTELYNGFFALMMICYSLYYIHKFHEIELCNIAISSSKSMIKEIYSEEVYEKDGDGDGEDNEQKSEQIYEQIEHYLESKEPYLNPDFRIAQMAFELNINAVYLAKAIRYKKGMNFNNLINFYRVEKAKKLIVENASKYTIKYIYLSSGFKSQSSFNRAFKFHANITPSEYYKKTENK